MKKIIVLMCSLILSASFCGCGITITKESDIESTTAAITTHSTEKTATAAKTEVPTTQAVQIKEDNDEWKQLYIDYINEIDDRTKSSFDYSLIYIDSDDIPELCLTGRYAMAGDVLCWINNNSVQEETALGAYGTSYIEKGGLLFNTGGRQGAYFDKVFSFDGKNLELSINGIYNEVNLNTLDFVYHINEEEVTQKEYEDRIDSAFNKSKAIKVSDETYSKEEIIDFIKNK